MGNTIRISESQFNRLFNTEDLVSEVISPLREILKCRITEDRKHITYLGRVYDGVTGEELPLTEQALGITKALGTTGKVGASDDDWSISDILHTGVDLVSTAADFIVPGSGMVIDIVHALSYMVEAQFSSGEEQDTLYLMAVITGMFAALPGALQAVAPILKRFVKTGGKMALKYMPILKTTWETISKNLSSFLSKLPGMVDDAVNSSIGKKILGGNVDKIASAIKNFSTRIKGILDKLKGNTDDVIKAGKEKIKKGKEAIKKKVIDPIIGKKNLKNWESILEKGKVVSKEGIPFDINSSQGKTIIAANPEKYLDKIVFDAQTGKAFAKNSDEGIEAIARNNKFLGGPGFKPNSNNQIPREFLDVAQKEANEIYKASTLARQGKEAGEVATKKVIKKIPKLNIDNSLSKKLKSFDYSKKSIKDFIKKSGGIKKIGENDGKLLTAIIRHTPGGSIRSLFRDIKLFSKSPSWKRFGMSLYQLLAIELTWSYTSWILCELGIKNRDDVEKMFELYESFGIEGIYDGDNAENGSWWINFFSALYNLSLILGDGFWSLIDQPCRSDNSIPKTLKNISNQLSSDTPYISDVKKVIDDLSSFLTIDLDTSTLEKNLNSEDIINSDKEDEKPKYGTIKKQ